MRETIILKSKTRCCNAMAFFSIDYEQRRDGEVEAEEEAEREGVGGRESRIGRDILGKASKKRKR